MRSERGHTWQDIQDRIRENIKTRVWAPGELIPGEAVLAEEFGCARTTVNRALRELATTGAIDRKRKAGTRVAMQTARRVTAEIPIIRAQIEAQQCDYDFSVLECRKQGPSAGVRAAMQLSAKAKALHIRSIHYADEKPFIYEDRWVNIRTIPSILNIDVQKTSINEWLVENVPFTNGEFIVEATRAGTTCARALALDPDDAVLKSQRSTWLEGDSVTRVNLYYAPGYQMRFVI